MLSSQFFWLRRFANCILLASSQSSLTICSRFADIGWVIEWFSSRKNRWRFHFDRYLCHIFTAIADIGKQIARHLICTIRARRVKSRQIESEGGKWRICTLVVCRVKHLYYASERLSHLFSMLITNANSLMAFVNKWWCDFCWLNLAKWNFSDVGSAAGDEARTSWLKLLLLRFFFWDKNLMETFN